MEYLEEKTLKGVSLKIMPQKMQFLAFDKDGKSIYADKNHMKLMHKIQVIIFLGENYLITNSYSRELSMIHVTKERMIVPYELKNRPEKKYVFIKFSGKIDTVPIALRHELNVGLLVKNIESSKNVDYFIVDEKFTRNDVIILKSRFPGAAIVVPEKDAIQVVESAPSHPTIPEHDRRATDLLADVNINLLSQNPVFLARVHLRAMDLSKVKQLLFDFNITEFETEYILKFIVTMLEKLNTSTDLKRSETDLYALKESFKLYLHLLRRDKPEIIKILETINDRNRLAFFSTILAKVKLLFPSRDDQLIFAEYDNLLTDIGDRM